MQIVIRSYCWEIILCYHLIKQLLLLKNSYQNFYKRSRFYIISKKTNTTMFLWYRVLPFTDILYMIFVWFLNVRFGDEIWGWYVDTTDGRFCRIKYPKKYVNLPSYTCCPCTIPILSLTTINNHNCNQTTLITFLHPLNKLI